MLALAADGINSIKREARRKIQKFVIGNVIVELLSGFFLSFRATPIEAQELNANSEINRLDRLQAFLPVPFSPVSYEISILATRIKLSIFHKYHLYLRLQRKVMNTRLKTREPAVPRFRVEEPLHVPRVEEYVRLQLGAKSL